MHSNDRFETRLVRFIVEGAASESARSLELLRAIEATVQVNELLAESFEQITNRFAQAVEKICGRDASAPNAAIDPDGAIQTSLETTLDTLALLVDCMKGERESAVRDDNLHSDDGVIESIDRAISSVTEAHSMLNELNWAVMEHDADRSPLSGKGPFRSAKELLAALSE